jgi:hypothetical protein
VASLPDYARDYYNWLVTNATADGALADPTKATEYYGEYYHGVVKVSGKQAFNFTSEEEVLTVGEQIAASALDAEFNAFTQWAGVAWDAFDREHPEVFWLSGRSSYSYLGGWGYSVKGNVCTVYYEAEMVVWLSYPGFDIRDAQYQTPEAVAADIERRDVAVAQILSGCPKENVYDQLMYLNDALTARNAYNSAVATGNIYGAPNTAWKCISALVGSNGKSGPVCEGYARAFQVLCNELNIPCVLVDGPAISSLNGKPESHMWNYVQIDGGWYAVDVTWNDPFVPGAPEEKVSGYETQKWMLLGSETQVADGLGFLASHEVVNQLRSDGLCFVNGPVLEPEAYVPNTSVGYTVSGTVSSANADDVTVQLLLDGVVVASQTLSGTSGSFTFENIAPGVYQLQLSKTDHVTYHYELTVDSDAVQDVKLRMLGDVTGDKRINVGDVARLYGHIKKTSVIIDPYVLLCMDMTGDGRLNVGDTARLYGKVRAK